MTCNGKKEIDLEDILITEELIHRLPKTPNLQAENQAMHTLARQLASAPQTMLKTLVTMARDLCKAGTAGVSLLETIPNGEEIFRWVALAGELEQYEMMEASVNFSPCGVCLEHQAPILYSYPARYFTYFQQTKRAIVESLVIPLIIDEQPLGTIWILSHDEQQHFDSEDVRIMTSLADFTAAALQSSQARQKAELAKLALQQSQAQVQSLIANMPGMVYRYLPCNDISKQFSFVSSGCRDLFEVEPSVALQDAGSILNLIHPDDLASFTASVGAAIENFLPWDWQGRIITPSGQLKWIHGRSSALQVEGQEVWDGLLIDITETKQAAEALRESEELKQRILESSTDCIKVLTLNSEIIYINTGGLCLLEVDEPESIIGANWSCFWKGKDYENALSALATAKAGNTGQFQGYLPTTLNTPKWWDIIISPIRDASGKVVQLLSISRDITEFKRIEAKREQAEIALREAHVQLESALVAGAVYTWRWNISTNCVIVNKAFAHLFGVDPTLASTSGLPIYLYVNAMHEEDRSRVWAAIERAIKSGEPYSAEYRVHTANGEERWVSARGQVEYDVDGNPVSLPGALIDITELKLAEVALRHLSKEIQQQLRKFDAVTSSVSDLIYTFDLSGCFTYANQSLLNILQKTLAELVGKNFFELDYPTDFAERLQRQIQEVITTRQSVKDETPYTSAFGTRAYEYIFVPLLALDGTVEGVAGTTRDITERKLIEIEREQILQREQDAREASRRNCKSN
jgi:PAS domain S-box-containing protein